VRPAEHVLTFDSSARVPVFHRVGGMEHEGRDLVRGFEARWSEWRTPCGQLVRQHLWVQHHRPYTSVTVLEHSRGPTWLRFDNASRIGRPCARCFPDLAATEGATDG
jgi:hypothetical protein